jgi:hypothetical protein
LPPELLTMREAVIANAAVCEGLVPGWLRCAMGQDFDPQIFTMHSAGGLKEGHCGLQLCARC